MLSANLRLTVILRIKSVNASFCLWLKCIPSLHTNCWQPQDYTRLRSPGQLQRPPFEIHCLSHCCSPYAVFETKCDQVTSLPNILQQLIPTALTVKQQGSRRSGLSPHLAVLPNWHLQVFITSSWVYNCTPLQEFCSVLCPVPLSPPASNAGTCPMPRRAMYICSWLSTPVGSLRCEQGRPGGQGPCTLFIPALLIWHIRDCNCC